MEEMTHAELIDTLKSRFEKNTRRHAGMEWKAVQARLESAPEKLKILEAMERTGGEPDVVGFAGAAGEVIFCDCSPESPAGRRSLCYDRKALDSRKENKPSGSALETAKAIGIEVLTEPGKVPRKGSRRIEEGRGVLNLPRVVGARAGTTGGRLSAFSSLPAGQKS